MLRIMETYRTRFTDLTGPLVTEDSVIGSMNRSGSMVPNTYYGCTYLKRLYLSSEPANGTSSDDASLDWYISKI
jgi:hypothetical protein